MRVELGARVLTSNGEGVGKIEKLVIDPETGAASLAVLRKSTLLTKDIEVRVEELQPGEDGTIRVRYTAEQVDRLPEFVEGSYTQATAGYSSPLGYPADGLVWPSGYAPAGVPTAGYEEAHPAPSPDVPDRATAAEIDDLQLNRDLTNAVIDAGDAVLSRDGEKVGEVHSVTLDTQSRHPTRLVVRKGFLFTTDVDLPGSAIDGIEDGKVYFKLTKAEVERAASKG